MNFILSSLLKIALIFSKIEKKHFMFFLLFLSIFLNFVFLALLVTLKMQYLSLIPLIDNQTELINALNNSELFQNIKNK